VAGEQVAQRLAAKLEQQPRDVDGSAFDLNDRSPATVQRADPRPARIRPTGLIDLLPKPLLERAPAVAKVTPRLIVHAFYCSTRAVHS
jgi:hypothetical protein